MKIGFYGAAQQVTGSKHMVTLTNGEKFLMDCGLFQGRSKEVRQYNANFGFKAAEIDFVILSHAHIDHSGLLPKLVKEGFNGPIYCTSATKDLCEILLYDSAYIQGEDIKYLNRKRKREGKELLKPLYAEADVEATLKLLRVIPYNQKMALSESVQAVFKDAGHILGSASVHLTIKDGNQTKRLGFTGDIGRYNNRILRDPQPIDQVDYLIAESTYGNRLHPGFNNAKEKFYEIIQSTCVEKGGKLVIPAFSVGRTQEIVYILNDLYNEKRLPKVPVFVDSPMAVSATEVMRNHPECFNKSVFELMESDPDPFGFGGLNYVRKVEDSKRINNLKTPCIIISASGMIEGGRIKHHIANTIENAKNTVLIVGYCSKSSTGAHLLKHPKDVRLFGTTFQVNARIEKINGFSAHGDYLEMARLLKNQNKQVIKKTFLVHGDPETMEDYKAHLTQEEGFYNVEMPMYKQEFEV